MRITEKQIKCVLASPGPKRYSHFIKMAADQRNVYGLYSNGWALVGDDAGNEFIPIWSAKEYAETCAINDWKDFSPKEIDLDEFIDSVIPDLKSKNISAAVMLTNHDFGVTPDFDDIIRDIKSELSRLE